ncbi:MAG: hypothetical protein FJY20_11585 [Bacteroidetes bacterium]|nr:hypothetical protein [Bacteroidota bacterium]
MKNLRTAVLCAGFAVCSLGSFAQEKTPPVNEPDYNKPRLFDGLPARIQLNADAISSLFATPMGRAASISLSEDNRFQFQGEVVSSGAKSQQVQSMVIRSTNFNGASFSISRITQADGTISYKGRIISFRHGDLYELENQNGQYVLVKKNFYDLVNE